MSPLPEPLKPGNRKTTYAVMAYVAICGGAWLLKGTFDAFATAMAGWMGLTLAAHVTQERLMKPPPPQPPARE